MRRLMTSTPGLVAAALACFATSAASAFVVVRMLRPTHEETRRA